MINLKKGQMKLSFGMIFSIMLIIIFIAFAFYAITKFLGWQSSITYASFANELQDDINRVWKSSGSTEPIDYNLPGNIYYICFIEHSKNAQGAYKEMYSELNYISFEDNLILASKDLSEYKTFRIGKINPDTYEFKNPVCFENKEGITITLSKEISESLVTIS